MTLYLVCNPDFDDFVTQEYHYTRPYHVEFIFLNEKEAETKCQELNALYEYDYNHFFVKSFSIKLSTLDPEKNV